MTTLTTLQDIIMKAHGLTREQLAPEATLTTLGIDSLDFIELLFQIEDDFKVQIPGDNPADLHSVGDVAAYIDQLVERQHEAAMVAGALVAGG
jgi:acyl carrier protein